MFVVTCKLSKRLKQFEGEISCHLAVVLFTFGGLVTAFFVDVHAEEKLGLNVGHISGHTRPHDSLLFPVELDGKTFSVMVDTGSSSNIVDPTLETRCEEYFETRTLKTSQKTISARTYRSFSASYGAQSIVLREASILDLTSFSRILGRKIGCILGTPFLQYTTLEFNPTSQTFRIGGPESEIHERFAQITLDAGMRPWIEDIHIDGIVHDGFLIDTGSNTPLSLAISEFDLLVARGALTLSIDNALVASPKTINEKATGILKAATVFGVRFSDVPVVRSGINKIGLEMLQRFSFFLDIPSSRLNVTPIKNFNRTFSLDRSGLHLWSEGDVIAVHSVDANSKAAVSGIQSGDIVQRIRGTAVTPKDLPFIRELLCEAKLHEVEIEIGRQESVILKKLTFVSGQ